MQRFKENSTKDVLYAESKDLLEILTLVYSTEIRFDSEVLNKFCREVSSRWSGQKDPEFSIQYYVDEDNHKLKIDCLCDNNDEEILYINKYNEIKFIRNDIEMLDDGTIILSIPEINGVLSMKKDFYAEGLFFIELNLKRKDINARCIYTFFANRDQFITVYDNFRDTEITKEFELFGKGINYSKDVIFGIIADKLITDVTQIREFIIEEVSLIMSEVMRDYWAKMLDRLAEGDSTVDLMDAWFPDFLSEGEDIDEEDIDIDGFDGLFD